ncbi:MULTISPECIES: alanyl-tRNA editing protein [Variovorax]|jgi:misacylated tRNA(Ala) deacylase|uniref:alanyl-tRNA editing protein n=1 Tax=Variovorax TaxID=34072 RepID=UPI00086BF87E|nr:MULTISPECIES: alanyl-tRNA editing protein [Variovorax]MBN8752338.1 alanyl-tRNA editing protein [Variovorax sp.]ODU18185.1 MAG: alanyl-tRNA editing protein [Variovorax sp. SCN 67-85]ODV26784.1 MAG: alanyl-tRNA editing protein [Variovorax sp. SCN 67-20]OJZ08874.1 MAG: alanyl-tRNA editing protein [Variovorax sp. 67-131]UKI11336.1 alanyl-tRNA editing protein [Variovorax paradoxus]
MSTYLCHTEPDCLQFEANVIARRANAVLLDRSYFYPGGGGQLADRGTLRWNGGELRISHVEMEGGNAWHCFDETEAAAVPGEKIVASVDPEFRFMMSQLHTGLHILNALVYQRFEGSLVTGVQMAADGTARIDFDLPAADNNELRKLEPELNTLISDGLQVNAVYLDAASLAREPGVLRSRSVAPPSQADGSTRIIEIVGLDRQACGGTHLSKTSQSAPLRILKIENKGQHNRRIRIGLVK